MTAPEIDPFDIPAIADRRGEKRRRKPPEIEPARVWAMPDPDRAARASKRRAREDRAIARAAARDLKGAEELARRVDQAAALSKRHE